MNFIKVWTHSMHAPSCISSSFTANQLCCELFSAIPLVAMQCCAAQCTAGSRSVMARAHSTHSTKTSGSVIARTHATDAILAHHHRSTQSPPSLHCPYHTSSRPSHDTVLLVLCTQAHLTNREPRKLHQLSSMISALRRR